MQVVPLYPNDYPREIPSEKQPRQGNPPAFINNIHYPTIEVYLPEKAKATGKAVVVCPGGGYTFLASDHEGRQIAEMFCEWGVAGIVLKYRLPPDYRHPIPMKDAQRAIRVVRANAREWNIAPNGIGIMGFSAGGHLASTAATHFDDGDASSADPPERLSCRPDFAVLGYPVIAFSKDYCHNVTRSQLIGEDLPEKLKLELSSELQVTSRTPPTFIFHSEDDKGVEVRNSIDFFLACKDHGVPAEMHLFPTGGHGYGVGAPGTAESQWPQLLRRWIQAMR